MFVLGRFVLHKGLEAGKVGKKLEFMGKFFKAAFPLHNKHKSRNLAVKISDSKN